MRDFYKREFDVELPGVAVNAENIRQVLGEFKITSIYSLFRKVTEPEYGDVVEMGYNNTPSHVGIWVDGRILHNHYFGGVVLEKNPPHDVLNFYRLGTENG